jgi:hypothetical protein
MLSIFCYFQNKKVSSELVQTIYETYLRNNLGYSTLYISNFMLESVNLISETWYEKIKSYTSENIAEKILISLALEGALSVPELSRLLHAEQSKIQETLTYYSSLKAQSTNKIEKWYKTDTVLSQAVQVIPSKFGKEKFRLTLVGILLVLYLLRKRDVEGNDNRFRHEDYNIEEYFSKIASNYQEKLPFIFGKWSKLKQTLGVMSCFNFDIILDKKFRSDSISSTDNSILYNSIRGIFADCKAFLSDLQVTGIFEMMNIVGKNYLTIDLDYKTARRKIWKKLLPVYELWIKLTYVMNEDEFDYVSVKDKLSKDESIDSENMAKIIYLYSIDTIEKSLANEISSLYYMNLDGYKFHHLPSHYLRKVVGQTFYGNDDSPMKKLLDLLKQDREIQHLIENMFQDEVNYHKRLATVIDRLRLLQGIH